MSVPAASVAAMQLHFGPGEDDAYHEAREALLDELDGWLDLPVPERYEVVSDVGLFLDWRYHESCGALDDFAPGAVAEFLLTWCPRRFEGRPDDALNLCFAVGRYFDLMAATGRMVGGLDRANRLRRLVDELAPTVLAEARNPTSTGSLPRQGKRDETAEKFGSVPVAAPEPYELPFLYSPPPQADVEAAVSATPLLVKFDALRGYLGSDGRQLTDRGMLQLADGRALAELLDTGDEIEIHFGERTWQASSTVGMRRLNFVVALAEEAGAVLVHRRRLVPVPAWAARSPLSRAKALFSAILELGPLRAQSPGESLCSDVLYELLDCAFVHWLVPLLAGDNAVLPFESVLELAESTVARKQRLYWASHELVSEFSEDDVSRVFEVLGDAGVVRWVDRVEVPEPFGRGHWTGGTVTLTAFGRHVLPDCLDDAGYLLRRAEAAAADDGAGLIAAMLSVDDARHEPLVMGWRAHRPVAERVQMLTETIALSASAQSRMMGFVALSMFDIEVVEPLVRQLLDTPVAGHAALWLISMGRADSATLGGFVDVGVLIDVLASDVEHPEALCATFTCVPEPLQLLENMWRHPAPETVDVLDALGRHLPDSKLAKAARKAAVRHRSWLANRRN